MLEYRFYLIRHDGHIDGPSHECVADDDAAALVQAKRLVDGHDVEVWNGPRLVAYLVPDKPETELDR